MRRKIPFILKTIILVFVLSYSAMAQVKRTNEDLIKLVDKNLSSPIKKRVYGNGDVFLQRDMNDFLSNTDRDRKAAIEKQNQSAKLQGAVIEYDHGGEDHEHLAEILNRPHPSVATTEKYLDDAAAEFRVPAIILKAAAQVQSNWAQTGPSFYGSYGMMGLIESDHIKQITLAASLTKSSVEDIKNEAKANIRAAAALLAYYQKGKPTSANLTDWFEATRDLTGLSNEEMKTSLATSFYNVIKNGSKTVSLWREIIQIDAQPVVIPEYKIRSEKKTENVGNVIQAGTDYPTAINRMTTCNYASGRNGYGVDYYFVHYMATGTYAGAISWFSDCTRTTSSSANYCIRNSDGEISQVVRESDRAYAQGVTGQPQWNGAGISTEHEVLATNLAMWDSEPMLVAAANLAIDVCNRNNIPRVRRGTNGDRGIYGHNDVKTGTDCPNLTAARWTNLLNRIAGGVIIPTVSLPTLYYITGTGGSNVVNAAWKANTEPTLKGYRLYYASDDDFNGWALAADESTLTPTTTSISLSPNQFSVVPTTTAVHFKLTAVVTNGSNPDVESAPSDVYSRTVNTTTGPRVLIVDAFDRINNYKSRSHNFAAIYFNTLKDNATMRINAAADEMIDAGTILLSDYDMVLWFTGDDSTTDKIFNGTNKTKVKTFLDNGGKLLITGSEIAWNLGRPGGGELDISFMNNYLKANYISDGVITDSPVSGVMGGPFEGVTFNLGENYQTAYPDNISPFGTAITILNYNTAGRFGGIAYKGTFGSGTTPGGIIFLGFPLETAPQAQITTFMARALAYFEVTLPVTLVDYHATLQNTGVVKLQWQTASETDNKEFILSRSVDGQQFNIVGKVVGSGNTTTGSNYVFYDKKPVNGINYYRLEQQDLDGKITDLGVRVVNVSLTDNKVEIYPNPTQDIVNVAFVAGLYHQIQLIDGNGKILKQIPLNSSTTQTAISLSNVASGIYLLRLNGNTPLVKKIIKN
ncbi:N-acetylmuramoyl-L-alanine amidase [Pedobacter xixiisoli]|uniref:N-acetylmuramoyl-L-alanine amidase n=1 Tax=Pedobacter xixiisoli TaxID=1476464 RepID=A0A286AAI5_9SPHI|nr:N-acetylmuramoyl-L-alanine amidase [Pedobacter xixiisoli]SOD18921.1 Por secretion system C-terminal sorting domain-containing protein [Pedobacter xixiisoli]